MYVVSKREATLGNDKQAHNAHDVAHRTRKRRLPKATLFQVCLQFVCGESEIFILAAIHAHNRTEMKTLFCSCGIAALIERCVQITARTLQFEPNEVK